MDSKPPTIIENISRFISQPWVVIALLAIVIGIVIMRRVIQRNNWDRSQDAEHSGFQKGYESLPIRLDLLGQSGFAITPLRPSGTIEVADEWVDVVTYGEFISVNKPVVIVEVEGTRIIVREAHEIVH